ncbi:C-C motif chemokine ligand 16 [Rhinolophus ferrumequinum]|uniref:C-C motif chemokine ligand 16 n=1 Tax=Rhinolophus ferrumequinum TaxID=59479 RepID=A0A671G256_RHIFE|nr:C-C motif chemokine 16 [Rhinolophus ferrumequinum]KAF6298209.1 C-C motif chemokine ligand 16 [Rhinolophus ferrumequinum]
MKFSVAALFLLTLTLILTTTSAFQSKIPESVNVPSTCCLKYRERVLPRKLVVGHRKALNCYLPAIILVTKKNREICVDPEKKWVQDFLEDPSLPLLPPRNVAQFKSIRS